MTERRTKRQLKHAVQWLHNKWTDQASRREGKKGDGEKSSANFITLKPWRGHNQNKVSLADRHGNAEKWGDRSLGYPRDPLEASGEYAEDGSDGKQHGE